MARLARAGSEFAELFTIHITQSKYIFIALVARNNEQHMD